MSHLPVVRPTPLPEVPFSLAKAWGEDFSGRIERAIGSTLEGNSSRGCPPLLKQALRYAVFPGGARIRPSLCLAVSMACGDCSPQIADAAGAAIELFHCASLVHDDLPCFDDAACRRGKPALHREFGEAMAVLTGDALIVLGFKTLNGISQTNLDAGAAITQQVCRAVDIAGGILAGQASELEDSTDTCEYRRCKTGALFEAAAVCGSLASGAPSEPWRLLGSMLGEAYQIADDISDVVASQQTLGKPVGRDIALDRPSVARELGVEPSMLLLRDTLRQAFDAIPACESRAELTSWLQGVIANLYRSKFGHE